MRAARSGVLAAGTFVVDRVVLIDRYPAEDTLAAIIGESRSSGGCPFNVLKDLAILGAPFPLAAVGALGADDDGSWVRADCEAHGIDTRGLVRIAGAVTSYTYAMTVQTTGRRTFFNRRGANALLAEDHFDFAPSSAKIFVLGYLVLLDALDAWIAPGMTGAARVLQRARAAGHTTVVDLVSSPHPDYRAIVESALPFVDHLLLNEWEAGTLVGRSLAGCAAAELLAAAREIAAAGVAQAVAIHCEDGAVVLDCRTGEPFVQAAVALPAAAVAGATGAGDAFTAGYLWALHGGEPPAAGLSTGVCAAAACLQDSSASGGMRPLDACLELAARYGFRAFG